MRDAVIGTWGTSRADQNGGSGAWARQLLVGPDAAAVVSAMVKDLVISRIGEPEEITRLVLFVASDEASFSTGAEFIADGGQLLGPVPDSARAAISNRGTVVQPRSRQ
jgi:NAD(P)-dependent dehydrogenase (short-subunit alcohol dehydrogenase family)